MEKPFNQKSAFSDLCLLGAAEIPGRSLGQWVNLLGVNQSGEEWGISRSPIGSVEVDPRTRFSDSF